ncbi:hypothetical protein BDN72DRAFT_834384 [Pluteus cervinus]|uniref:Uncharacterized protein n=1 Tax=Pluteus cervinus TaxID=181527 RepID=A0ACD3B628_9AGAR|nr:hypothetical protein BDN72DRAFT_834384 [Pluteus cervinus]
MPPPKGPLWDHFLTGSKQNNSHVRAHCRSCIEKQRPEGTTIELDDNGNTKLMSSQSWVLDAMKSDVGGVLGVRRSMLAHILGKGGSGPCPNVGLEVKKLAKSLKSGKSNGKENRKREREDSDSGSERSDDSERKERPKKKHHTKVKEVLQQTESKVYRGPNIPFEPDQEAEIRKQFLKATISANLPFQWVEDPEVIKLFLMFRATADEVMPSRQQLKAALHGESRDSNKVQARAL